MRVQSPAEAGLLSRLVAFDRIKRRRWNENGAVQRGAGRFQHTDDFAFGFVVCIAAAFY